MTPSPWRNYFLQPRPGRRDRTTAPSRALNAAPDDARLSLDAAARIDRVTLTRCPAPRSPPPQCRGHADARRFLSAARGRSNENTCIPRGGRVEERMRPGFLDGVTAGQVEDQRSFVPPWAEVQVARDQRPVPGNVEVLEAIGRQRDHLVVATAQARVEIALLLVVFEDDVLAARVQDGGLEVEISAPTDDPPPPRPSPALRCAAPATRGAC